NKEAARQAELASVFPHTLLHALNRSQAELLAGVGLRDGGLFYPDAGWVHPPALCRRLSQDPAIELRTHSHPVELQRNGELWQAVENGVVLAEAPVAILAGAADVARFEPKIGRASWRGRGEGRVGGGGVERRTG